MICTDAGKRYTFTAAGAIDLLVSPRGEVVATVTSGFGESAARLANLVRTAQAGSKWTAAARANAQLMSIDGYTDEVMWDDATGDGYTADQYRKLLG